MIRRTFPQKTTPTAKDNSSEDKSLESSPEMSEKEVSDYPVDDFHDLLSPVESSFWQSQGKGILIGLGIGILLSLGMSQFLIPKSASSPPKETSQAVEAAETPKTPAKPVTLATVKFDQVDQKLSATGSIAAFEPIDLYAQANSLQIRQVLADEGDYIQAGQVLVILDDSMQQAKLMQARARIAEAEAKLAELKAGSRSEEIKQAKSRIKQIEAELTQSKADLEYAQLQVQRNLQLKEEGAIELNLFDQLKTSAITKQAMVTQTEARLREAKQALEELENGARPEVIAQATAQLADAKAQYQISLSEIRDTKIVSPVSGKISQRTARVGNVTSPSQKLFTIIEDGRLELRLKVPETQLTAIRPGQTVVITSDADRNLNIRGTVREIEPRIDENSRQGIVRVDLSGKTDLKPGMFLRGAIVTSNKNSLTVPLKAVLPQPDGKGQVYVIQPDETVKATKVVLGEMLPQGQIEIVEGLKPNDRVVVKGAAYLNDGDRILVSRDE